MPNARTQPDYTAVNPGFELQGPVHDRLFVPWEEGEFGGFSIDGLTRLKNPPLLAFGGGIPYVAAEGTETKDNSGTIARVGGGLRFQTQASPSANDDVTFRSAAQQTLAAGQILCGTITVQASVAAEVGLVFGIVTSSATEVHTGNPADGIYIFKANNSADMVGRVVENTAAADDVALATLTDLTDVRVTFKVKWNDSGAIEIAAWYVNGTKIDFTSDQRTALTAMLATSAPTVAGLVGMRGPNSTTQRHAIAKGFFLELF